MNILWPVMCRKPQKKYKRHFLNHQEVNKLEAMPKYDQIKNGLEY